MSFSSTGSDSLSLHTPDLPDRGASSRSAIALDHTVPRQTKIDKVGTNAEFMATDLLGVDVTHEYTDMPDHDIQNSSKNKGKAREKIDANLPGPNFDRSREKGKAKATEEADEGSPEPAPTTIHMQTRFRIVDIPTQEVVDGQGRNFDEVLHPGISCDGPHCVKKREESLNATIWGNRFHCMSCKNIDYCSRCIKDVATDHSVLHAFIRIIFPVRIGRIYRSSGKDWSMLIASYPLFKNTALTHAVQVETILRWVPPSVRPFLSEFRPSIFGVGLDPGSGVRKPRFIDADPEPPEGEDYTIMYDIDENANITRTYQRADQGRREVRKAGVFHHHSRDLLASALTERLRYYRYHDRTEFYKSQSQKILVTRVIDVKPGKLDDRIEFELRTVSLGDPDNIPEYESLSYTWKETANSRALQIRGGSTTEVSRERVQQELNLMDIKRAIYCGNEYLEINEGLYDALQRLRHPKQTRTLWADQICINQNDDDEKKYQIQNMGHVYYRATKSIIWVGEHDDDSRRAMEMVDIISHLLAVEPHLGLDPRRLIDASECRLPEYGSPIWLALVRFICRPIYERAWVMQEFVFARNLEVQCGDDIMPLSNLRLLIRLCNHIPWMDMFRQAGAEAADIWSKSNMLNLTQINGIREDWQLGRAFSLERMIWLTTACEATDDRDRIYALMGIALRFHPAADRYPMPDYTKTTVQTFTDAARFIMSSEDSLAVLGLVSHALVKKPMEGLPSWCPDFTATKHAGLFSLNRPIPPVPYKCHGDSEITVLWPYENQDLLVTSSTKVGTVTVAAQRAMTEQADIGEVIAEWTLVAEQCTFVSYPSGQSSADGGRSDLESTNTNTIDGAASSKEAKVQRKAGEAIELAFCRVLLADATIPDRQKPSKQQLRALGETAATAIANYVIRRHGESKLVEAMQQAKGEGVFWYDLFERMMMSECDGQEAVAEESGAVQAMPLSGHLKASSIDKRFFLTDRGTMGVGAMDLQPGDEVHILSGAKVPVILRPISFPEPHHPEGFDASMRSFHLVGEAYVHGIMYGAAVKQDAVWEGICIH